MSLSTVTLPRGLSEQLVAPGRLVDPGLDHFFLGSWEQTAHGIQNYLHFLTEEVRVTKPPASYFLALETITTGTQVVEYLGTHYLRTLRPKSVLAHQAENPALAAAFNELKQGGAPLPRIARLLHTPEEVPRLRGYPDSQALRRAHKQVLKNARAILRDAASFWVAHIDRVRWFRHCPAFLLPSDTFLLDPGERQDRTAALEATLASGDVVFAYVEHDHKQLSYSAVRELDVQGAVGLGNAVIQLLFMAFGNMFLDRTSPDPAASRLKIARILLHGIDEPERALLRDHGHFYLVP